MTKRKKTDTTDLPFSKAETLKSHRKKKSVYSVEEFKAEFCKEEDLQRQCEEYLKIRRVQYIRFPDSAWRILRWLYKITQNRYLALFEKVKFLNTILGSHFGGMPDLVVLDKCGSYLCFELKVKGRKMSTSQNNWALFANVVKEESFEHFKTLVDRLLEEEQEGKP